MDFGTWKTDKPDIYTVYLTVDLKSANDMEHFNDQFTRPGEPAFTFEVRDEIEAEAYAINSPKNGGDIIAGRPFTPSIDLRNNGVGDITNCPTTITVTDEATGKIVFTETISVQDIPSGRYNVKSVKFDQKIIKKAGRYRLTLTVNHPDDLVKDNNSNFVVFNVVAGLGRQLDHRLEK